VSITRLDPRYYDRDILKPTRDGGDAACRLLIDRYARSGEIGRMMVLVQNIAFDAYEADGVPHCDSGYRLDVQGNYENWGQA